MSHEMVFEKLNERFLKTAKKKSGTTMDERVSRLYALKGFTLETGRALRFLVGKDASDVPGEIADILGISRSQMTGIADYFEKLGYVERIRDKEDRRKQHLVLTKVGREVAQDLEDFCREFHLTVSDYIDDDDLITYFKVKKQIESEMLDQLDAYDKTGSFRKKGE